MALKLGDRVRETSTTTGTGNIALGGAVAGYQSFDAALDTGDTTYYAIVQGDAWEVGTGTFTAPSTLARTTVFSSSTGGGKVNFGAGSKDVFITVPAGKALVPLLMTPSNVSPANGAQNVGGSAIAFTGTQFSSLYSGSLAAVQVHVSADVNFNSLAWDSGEVAASSPSVTLAKPSDYLAVSTLYRWRLRYKDGNGNWSDWSDPTTFSTSAQFRPNIGQAYQGGFYAGQITDGGAVYDLIVAPSSSVTSLAWDTGTAATTNKTSRANGPDNTELGAATRYAAAKYCRDLVLNGYSDWYLPAIDELEVAYRNLKPTTGANNVSSGQNANAVPPTSVYTTTDPAQTTAAAFQTGGSEAFTTGAAFWASTEFSSTAGHNIIFSNGFGSSQTKSSARSVRPFRHVLS